MSLVPLDGAKRKVACSSQMKATPNLFQLISNTYEEPQARINMYHQCSDYNRKIGDKARLPSVLGL